MIARIDSDDDAYVDVQQRGSTTLLLIKSHHKVEMPGFGELDHVYGGVACTDGQVTHEVLPSMEGYRLQPLDEKMDVPDYIDQQLMPDVQHIRELRLLVQPLRAYHNRQAGVGSEKPVLEL